MENKRPAKREKKGGGGETRKTSSYSCAYAESGESTQEMEEKILKQVTLNGGVRFFLKKGMIILFFVTNRKF